MLQWDSFRNYFELFPHSDSSCQLNFIFLFLFVIVLLVVIITKWLPLFFSSLLFLLFYVIVADLVASQMGRSWFWQFILFVTSQHSLYLRFILHLSLCLSFIYPGKEFLFPQGQLLIKNLFFSHWFHVLISTIFALDKILGCNVSLAL